MDLQRALHDAKVFTDTAAATVYVAYSGGLDSSVLLLLVQRLLRARGEPARLRAVHVQHGWPASVRMAAHAQAFCVRHEIPLQILSVDARPQSGEGREAAARAARRAGFAAVLRPAEVILSAQHREDQAETVLLRLLRGSGPEGLAAMEPRVALGAGWMLRPWLRQARTTLQCWAEQNAVEWIEDPSNADLSLDRNYVRHALWPQLDARWPGVAQRLGHVAQHAADTRAVLESHFSAWLAGWDASLADSRLPLAALRALDLPAQRLLLRAAARARGLRLPGGRRLDEALAQFHGAAEERLPEMQWQDPEHGSCSLRRYRDALYWVATDEPLPLSVPWAPRVCALQQLAPGQGLAQSWLQHPGWRLGRRGADERMWVAPNRPRRSLRKLMQEAGVPPWQRDRYACLWHGERLVAVDRIWIDPEYRADPAEVGWIPDAGACFR